MVEGETLLLHSTSVISYTPPDKYACKIHLNENPFHTALPATVPLNNSGLKGDLFELRHLEGEVPGNCGEVTSVVVVAVALALLIAFVPGCSE